MKANGELQKDVQDAMNWEPLLSAAEIGVTVADGVVTLTGNVDSFGKKNQAESAARNVAGVSVVVQNIQIKSEIADEPSDTAIAAEVLEAFRGNWEIPNEKLIIKVESGWVTLEGEIPWDYQRSAAKKTVTALLGVKGVINNIRIKSEIEDAIEKQEIEKAFERNWSIKADDITVTVAGTTVTLTGTVTSWYQKEEARKIAYKAPGVCLVNNDLIVESMSFS